jgi:phosphoribosylformimino-5-aminoimidazole carboxamide ribotide isomerase
MRIFPATDIKNGECVRLYKGDFGTVSKVYESPLKAALDFKSQGASDLHIVDLDGSLEGRPININIITEIKTATGMFCEVGGGIRNMSHVEGYLKAGIDRVILGTSALTDIEFTKTAVKNYPDNVSIGIDADQGIVKGWGWTSDSGVDYITFAKMMEYIGVKHIIYTDIQTDGTLQGPNFEHLENLSRAVSMDITASGGIRNKEHIDKLKAMGLYGAICGKSLYSGTLKLSEIL